MNKVSLGDLLRENLIEGWLPGALSGDAVSQRQLGIVYGGLGSRFEEAPPVSMRDAIYWLEQAAEQGDAEAATTLGMLYADGRKVKPDRTRARHWLSEAMKRGSADAVGTLATYECLWDRPPETAAGWLALGMAFRVGRANIDGQDASCGKNSPVARQCFERASELGSAEAAYEVARLYETMRWTKLHRRLAIAWLSRAAEGGHAAAQAELGDRFQRGKGVHQDSAEAVRWFARAAQQGHVAGQFSLGCCNLWGNGVRRDPAAAIQWLSMAAAAGHVSAQNELGYAYSQGIGVKQDYKQAAEWYTKAAEQGHDLARYNLGVLYLEGRGVTWSRRKAIELMGKVAVDRYGHESARKAVARRGRSIG